MIHAASLSALPGIRHAFFTRDGGVSEGVYASLNAGQGSNDDPERVRENRARMAAAVGVTPDRFLTAYQVHSAFCVIAEAPWSREDAPKVDAIVTREPGLAIGASSADCGPILFADADVKVIGAAHAGWRGALGGVLESTIECMERLGANRARIRAVLGPMIAQANYEVGPDFITQFSGVEGGHARFLKPAARTGHALFNLPGYIRHRLTLAGLAHIEDLALCTYADPARFYSYRRMCHNGEPDYGRHVSAIALAP